MNDKINQINQLESKLRREISMDIDDDIVEYEVEADKVKILFMNDDGDSTDERGEIIELDPKKLYLGFPNYQNVH